MNNKENLLNRVIKSLEDKSYSIYKYIGADGKQIDLVDAKNSVYEEFEKTYEVVSTGEEYYRCPCCKEYLLSEIRQTKYCHNCGAKIKYKDE